MLSLIRSAARMMRPSVSRPCFKFASKTEMVIRGKTLISAQSKLSKIVQKELKHEEENYEIEPESTEVFEDKGFTLQDKNTDINMYLTKEVEGTQISIHFVQKTPVQQEEENEEQEEDIFDFTVYAVKGNGGVSFDCSAINGENQINFVTTFEDYNTFKKLNKYEKTFVNYLGPEFSSLEENKFYDLLESYGVNNKLVNAMASHAEDKEQRLYLKWLKDLDGFLNH